MSCVPVCLSVTTLVLTSFLNAQSKVHMCGYRLFLDSNLCISKKQFCYGEKSQYANYYVLTVTMAHFERQGLQLLEGQT